jgi:hypothetical protein
MTLSAIDLKSLTVFTGMNKSKLLTMCAVTSTSVGLVVFLCCVNWNPDVIALLRNNKNLQISSFKLYNAIQPSLNVSITNVETMSYITRAIRDTTNDLTYGEVCRARITLSNGKYYDVTFVTNQGGKSVEIGVGNGMFKDEANYGIKLEEPIPNELTEAIRKMTTPEIMRL